MTQNDILNTARAELGYKEGSGNDNKYGREYGLNKQPWCVIFLWWCFKHTIDGATEKLSDFMPNSAHCNGVRSFALNIDRWYPRSEIGLHVEPEAGDLVVWDWNGDGSGDHIGIIETVWGGNDFTTIEGNCSDGVRRMSRNLDNVLGLYKPLYNFDFRAAEQQLIYFNPDTESTPTPEPEKPTAPEKPAQARVSVDLPILRRGSMGSAVKALQALLNLYNFNVGHCGIDGELGPDTARALGAFQEASGIERDEICGAETWAAIIRG